MIGLNTSRCEFASWGALDNLINHITLAVTEFMNVFLFINLFSTVVLCKGTKGVVLQLDIILDKVL